MRGLDDSTYATVSAIDREHIVPISPAMLEKDILVREATLAIKDAGQKEGCQLVFAGGTALSQAHQIIERMSEDADFRIVVPEGLSSGQTRKLLSMIKAEVVSLLDKAGFPLVGEMKGRNNNAYMMGEFAYQSRFSGIDEAIRDYLKLEIVAFAPITPASELPLATIVDQVTGMVSNEETILTVSVIDTLADKLVGYLRRTSQERAGLTRGDFDHRLVRHIYDIHSIVERLSHSPDQDKGQFIQELSGLVSLTIERDIATYGNQNAEFAENPRKVLQDELSHLQDDDVRVRYGKFCGSMIWGKTPTFDEATHNFATLANAALLVDGAHVERNVVQCGDAPTPAALRRKPGKPGRGLR